MLGKQGWRFITNPESLVAKVFKARYFVNGDFLTAELGSNPSYVWRSVWEAQDLIKKCARWMIATGEKIDICKQPWLNNEENPYVSSESQAFTQNKVSSLMRMDAKVWDDEVVKDLFNDCDQHCIFNTPIQSRLVEDKIYWSKENSGNYSVKSGYRLLQEQKILWNERDRSNLWRILWRFKAPAKVLNVLWRAATDCLPTLVMLNQKQVPVLCTCPICNVEDETIIHALVCCPMIAEMWLTIHPDIHQDTNGDFFSWLKGVFEQISQDRRAMVATVCWAMWKHRNEKVWNNRNSSQNGVLYAAKQYLTQWRNTQNRDFQVLSQAGCVEDGAFSWVAPQELSVKVNVDAAIFSDQNSFGVGVIARDCRGELIQAKSVLTEGNVDPALAEVMTIKEALSWIEERQ